MVNFEYTKKSNKIEVIPIFPEPLGMGAISHGFTEDEIKFIKEKQDTVVPGTEDYSLTKITENRFILNEPPLARIRDEVHRLIKDYINEVYCNDEVEGVITQSWINYSNPGDYHHEHFHPNSLISGVIYVSVEPGSGVIHFKRPHLPALTLEHKRTNQYNNNLAEINVSEGLVLMFPSYLRHYVPTNKSNDVRVSIAFNSFIKGSLGSVQDLTYLEIK